MEPEMKEKLEAFKKDKLQEVKQIVNEKMLEKILHLRELTKLLKKAKSDILKHENIDTKSTTDGSSNSKCLEISRLLINELMDLLNIVDTLRLNTILTIPAVGQGNGFETTVQTELIGELGYARASALLAIGVILRDYLDLRADILRRIKKDSKVGDFKNALEHLDESHAVYILKWTEDVFKVYLVLKDMIEKNNESMVLKMESPSVPKRRKLSSSGTTPTQTSKVSKPRFL